MEESTIPLSKEMPLTDVLREIDASDSVGSEDSGLYAELYQGPMEPVIFDVLDELDVELAFEDAELVSSATAGLILSQISSTQWAIEVYDDPDDLDEDWYNWDERAGATYGELMDFDESD